MELEKPKQETGQEAETKVKVETAAKPVEKATKPAAKPAKPAKHAGKIAVIFIRNTTRADRVPRDTLEMLRLHKKYTCVVLENNPGNLGMVKKVKDYVAYGEIDDNTISLLEQKRGKKDKEGKLKKDFHLHPPKGGFERKGIKHSYTQGGALGYRGEKINILIKKMV